MKIQITIKRLYNKNKIWKIKMYKTWILNKEINRL